MDDQNESLANRQIADLIMDIMLLVFIVSVLVFGFVFGIKLAGF